MMRTVVHRRKSNSRREKNFADSNSVAPPIEYVALRQKVDAFSDGVSRRRAADLACRSGCAGCCHVELSVSAVEAAAIADYLVRLSEKDRAERFKPRVRRAETNGDPRCVMLRDDDTCAIYEVRPLVCRSQGLPLLYPANLIKKAAQRGLTADGRALTFCPLNFQEVARPPARDDILDAERVDVVLSVINRQFAAATGTSPERRYALADLVKEFVE